MLFNRTERTWRERLLPFTLTAGVMLLDQATKMIVLRLLKPLEPVPIIGEFLRFRLVQNPAISFSIGHNLPPEIRRVLFLILPLAVVALLTLYYLFTRDPFTLMQRWCFAALIGGGLGNYVDRIFRPAGVVDFVEMKVYGFLGMQYWPIYNLSDATAVVSAILLFISFLLPQKKPAQGPEASP